MTGKNLLGKFKENIGQILGKYWYNINIVLGCIGSVVSVYWVLGWGPTNDETYWVQVLGGVPASNPRLNHCADGAAAPGPQGQVGQRQINVRGE